MAIRLNGSTSGYIEIDAPAVAGTTAITLPATSGGNFVVTDSAGDLNIDSGTFFVDASTNRVGVGTTSPASALEIVSDVNSAQLRVESSSSGNRAQMRYTNAHSIWETGISGDTTGDFLIAGSTEDTDIRFYTRASGANQSEKVRIDANGRVGIGTSSPGSNTSNNANQLVVGDNTNSAERGITIGSTTGGGIRFNDGADAGLIEYNHASNFMRFVVNGSTEAARIDSSGRVGIGTSSPGATLEILDSATNTYLRLSGNSANAQDTNYAGIEFYNTDSSGAGPGVQAWIEARNIGATGVGADLAFGTFPSASSPEGARGIERMRITGDGNVGIGTTSPSEKLSVVGNADFSGASPFITLNGSAVNQTATIRNNNGSSTTLKLLSGNIVFGSDTDAERARIDTSGRLLVGTSTANSTFTSAIEVAGTAADSTTLLTRYANSSYGPVMYIGKSRGASVGTNTIVQSGDELGKIDFRGANGSGWDAGAQIKCHVDGTPGSSSDMPGRLVFLTTPNSSATPTERMRIRSTNTATVMMNCTASDDTGVLQLRNTVGTAHCLGLGTSSSNADTLVVMRHGCNANGSGGTTVGSITCNSTSTTYGTSSDYRLKENVVNLAGAINRVKQLAPKQFNFIIDPNKVVDGFLAHEAQAIVPEAVYGTHNEVDDDGNPVYQSIDQSKLVPLLTAALQEAIAKIETLETKVAALEAN